MPAADLERTIEQEIVKLLGDKAALASAWHEGGLPLSGLQGAIDFGRRVTAGDAAALLEKVDLSQAG